MLPKRLKELRKRDGISQEELAAIIGVDRSSIGKYEGRQGVIPSADVLRSLADHFNTTVDYLLGRTSDPINYEDGELVAGLSSELIDHFQGDIKKAYAAKRAIDKDARDEFAREAGIESWGRPILDAYRRADSSTQQAACAVLRISYTPAPRIFDDAEVLAAHGDGITEEELEKDIQTALQRAESRKRKG